MRKWVICLLVPALLLAGCSDDGGDSSGSPSAEEDPTNALIAAIERTAASETQTVTVTLQSTPESLAAASEGSLPPGAAETILGSSVTVSTTGGDDPARQSGGLTIDVPGTEGAEILFSGSDLYLRADVRGLAETFGQNAATVDAFLQSPVAQQAPFLQAAADGKFIKIEGTEEMAGNTGATQELAEQRKLLLGELGEIIRADGEVTSEGEDDTGEHLLLSVPLAPLYQRAGELWSSLVPGGLPPQPSPEFVPEEGDLVLDVWLSEGDLAQVEVDLVRFNEEVQGDMPPGVEELAVRMGFSDEAEPVDPPADAVTVTGDEIMSLIFGGAFGGGGFPGDAPTEAPDTSGGGEDVDCSIYEGLPPESFEGLPPDLLEELEKICPEVVPD
ncbi:MAG: hypothetical protein M3198_16210 [Actinomycetota bacterium]|nr:hypothetical protein [Actinomycetota bacterium]